MIEMRWIHQDVIAGLRERTLQYRTWVIGYSILENGSWLYIQHYPPEWTDWQDVKEEKL